VLIKSVEFAGAIGSPGGTPPGDLPQIAFSGRSNVGKSSLINRLLGRTRTHVARVSATPGKTQQINFYRVIAADDANEQADIEFFLVDLPGYGYARVPGEVRETWRPMIEGYLSKSDQLIGVVQLIDARHGPSAEDLKMVDYLADLELPALFAFTKIDKLKRSERERNLADTMRKLALDAEQVIPFSAITGEGRELLLDSLHALYDSHGEMS
jgi:GTP-binding protein